MIDWLLGGDFVVRTSCGDWGETLPWLSITANLTIAVSYFLIPIALLQTTKSRVILKQWPAMLFAVFIFFCGLGHLCDVMAFYWPAYRVFLCVDIATAISSALVAAAAPAVVRALLL